MAIQTSTAIAQNASNTIDPTTLQKGLVVLGARDLAVDGIVGNATRNALRAWAQRVPIAGFRYSPMTNTRGVLTISPASAVGALRTAASQYQAAAGAEPGSAGEGAASSFSTTTEGTAQPSGSSLALPSEEPWYKRLKWWHWGLIGFGAITLFGGAKHARRRRRSRR